MIHKSVITDFSPKACEPVIGPEAFVHPMAAVIGNVTIGKKVMVAPFASVRGDEGQSILINDQSNIQDGVVIHGLETEKDGEPVTNNIVEVDGTKCSVFIGKRVSLAHQAQVHGPAVVGDDSFIGMKSLIFKARVGKGCVIEPGSIVIGVSIPDGRYVPAGTVLREETEAEKLPEITPEYAFKDMNKGVVHVNTALAVEYGKMSF